MIPRPSETKLFDLLAVMEIVPSTSLKIVEFNNVLNFRQKYRQDHQVKNVYLLHCCFNNHV